MHVLLGIEQVKDLPQFKKKNYWQDVDPGRKGEKKKKKDYEFY